MICDDVFDRLTRGPFPSGAPEDGAVEAHLSHCVSCRRLAEALRPAVELFQEAVGPEECFGLPGYHGEEFWPELRTVTSQDGAASDVGRFDLSREIESSVRYRADSPSMRISAAWWRFLGAVRIARRGQLPVCDSVAAARGGVFRGATAVLLGVSVVIGLLALMLQRSDQTFDGAGISPVAQAGGTARSVGNLSEQQWLSSLGLPASCMPRFNAGRGSAVGKPSPRSSVPPGYFEVALRQDCCTECHNTMTPGLLSVAEQTTVTRACRACH